MILQVSLNMLKPEKPCGEEEASELQGLYLLAEFLPLCRGTWVALWNVSPPPWLWDWLEEGPLPISGEAEGSWGESSLDKPPWRSKSSPPGGEQEPWFSPGPFCP